MRIIRYASLGVALLAGACTVQQLPPGQYPSTQYPTTAQAPPPQPAPTAPPVQQPPPSGQAQLPPSTPTPAAPTAAPPRPVPIPRVSQRPPAAALNDPQIVGVVESFYNARIRLAGMAQARGNDPSVRSFAARAMQSNQSRRAQTQNFGIQPAATPVSTGINLLNEREIGALATQTGSDFDQGYLTREYVDNQHFLQLLDQTLIPSASNVQLRAQLVLLRPQYEADMREASTLRASVQATAGRATPAGRGGRATGGTPVPVRKAPTTQPPSSQQGTPPAQPVPQRRRNP